MSTGAMDRIKEKLARARAVYRERLSGNLDALVELTDQARHDADKLVAAQQLAHRICGSAGTFGFAGVSEATGAVDRALLALLSGQLVATPALWQQIDEQLQRARALD